MRSLWVDPDDQHFPPLSGNHDVDVAILGGGFSGIGAAYAFRDSGLSAVLLEARTVASGASGRNAGFVLAGPASGYAASVEQLGNLEAEEVWRFTLDNNRTIARIVEDQGIDCGYLRRGSMSLAGSEEERQRLHRDARALTASAFPVCVVERSDLPPPLDRHYHGGLLYFGNAEMNPGRFIRAVAGSARRSVDIHEGTLVEKISKSGTWLLEGAWGSVRARSVIVATNAYTGVLLRGLPISPARGQVMATEPLTRMVSPYPMYANNGYQYWRQTAEGRLVVGGWRDLDMAGETGVDERLHRGIQCALDGFAEMLLGAPPNVEYRWAGIMGFTPDRYPLVGALEDGLWIAAGYSGHGVSMAFSCGMRVAEKVLGRSVSIPSSFGPARFAGAYSRA
ncbi:MAG: NAD(P)/FAD-dependent oxidoreductase [Chloroflexota bacterium]